MKKLYFAAAIFLACVLEVTALNHFRIFNVKPNLLLIAVVTASLIFDFKWAIFFSITAGVLKDVFCPASTAFNTVLFACFSLLITILSRKISVENNYVRAALVFVILFLNTIAYRIIFIYLGRHVAAGIFFRVAFLESLYTLLISCLVFRIIRPILQS